MVLDAPTIAGLVETAALHLVHRHSLEEIEKLLIDDGVPARQAAKLVLLIPSAFAREHFEPDGIAFPDSFLVGDPDRPESRLYSTEPFYVEARRLARVWAAESRPSLVLRVLDWSAEAKSIKEAKARGLTPTRLAQVHHGFEP